MAHKHDGTRYFILEDIYGDALEDDYGDFLTFNTYEDANDYRMDHVLKNYFVKTWLDY